MRHKNFGERYIVRLESGECAVERLMEFAATEHIGFANVSAAGAVNWVRLAYWNATTKKYEEREEQRQPISVTSRPLLAHSLANAVDEQTIIIRIFRSNKKPYSRKASSQRANLSGQ